LCLICPNVGISLFDCTTLPTNIQSNSLTNTQYNNDINIDQSNSDSTTITTSLTNNHNKLNNYPTEVLSNIIASVSNSVTLPIITQSFPSLLDLTGLPSTSTSDSVNSVANGLLIAQIEIAIANLVIAGSISAGISLTVGAPVIAGLAIGFAVDLVTSYTSASGGHIKGQRSNVDIVQNGGLNGIRKLLTTNNSNSFNFSINIYANILFPSSLTFTSLTWVVSDQGLNKAGERRIVLGIVNTSSSNTTILFSSSLRFNISTLNGEQLNRTQQQQYLTITNPTITTQFISKLNVASQSNINNSSTSTSTGSSVVCDSKCHSARGENGSSSTVALLPIGSIIGISVGGICVLFIIVGVCCCVCRRNRNRKF
jgi:hypothetical protein